MSALTNSTLLFLPRELLLQIISYLPDEDNVSVAQTCTKLKLVCSWPVENRKRCLQYKYWEDEHDISNKFAHRPITDIDWRKMFTHRFNVDRRTTAILNRIIESPTNRIVHFNEIADFGYDAKDTLERHAMVKDDEVLDPLARRWHAQEAIRYIHRRRGLKIMKRIEAGHDVPLEIALSSLELFDAGDAAHDEHDTVRRLDELAQRFLQETADFHAFSIPEQAEALTRWLWKEGYVDIPVNRYLALKNLFIGLTMRSVHSARPTTLVAIFCSIARRIGLTAHPCAPHNHAYAIVQDENGDSLYYDVFCTSRRAPLITTEEIAARIPDRQLWPAFLQPAGACLMVNRTAQALLHCLQRPALDLTQHNHGYPRICTKAALQAALTSIVMLSSAPLSPQIVTELTHFVTKHPMDVRFLEEEVVPRVSGQEQRAMLENVCNAMRCEDSEVKTGSTRDTKENSAVKYRIGTVFTHKRYHYTGIIHGWTPVCMPSGDSEGWVRQMKVDKLPKGPKQPFYNVLVTDHSPRYVAEENIIPINVDQPPTEDLDELGMFFKRWDPMERRFVSNITHEFPDD
ncbi:YccV-like-domain-containing protein [Ascodesmis nigricans]|uniref:YccV-like-domain-containing protein n=1 Tax=Ascodesmis nigricans TaxID=341454 RepID=A0A4S2MUD5_9PEZI|nr:YccV-like-domain-containing protein [Ascodesmis nigricans]